MAGDLPISDLPLLPDHSQRRDPRTCPPPKPFPTCRRALGGRQQGSHLCGDQAGLATVLGIVTHLHIVRLFLGDLLTHHGYLALPGVAPKDGGKNQTLPALLALPQQVQHHACMHTRSHTQPPWPPPPPAITEEAAEP